MSKKKRRRPKNRYPNQQAATIHKKLSHTKKNYFTIDRLRSNAAMRDLAGVAFKMYIYLCQHRDGDIILLSAAEFCKDTGSSQRSYLLAKKELVERRYLILRQHGDYDFYNEPQIEEPVEEEPKKPKKPLTKEQATIARLMGKYVSEDNIASNNN